MPKRVLKSETLARLAVDVASDKQASDIVLLDIRKASDFADYFVIMSTDSARQRSTLAEELEQALAKRGGARLHLEGDPTSGWMVLDYGDVVIHLFGAEEREFYDLEGAWDRAVEVVRIQ